MAVRDFTVQSSAGVLTCAMHVVHLLPDFSLSLDCCLDLEKENTVSRIQSSSDVLSALSEGEVKQNQDNQFPFFNF